MEFSLSAKDLDGSHDKLQCFHDGYTLHFLTKTRNMAKQSFQYIQGKLLGKGRGNMCSYAKDVPDCNNQSLQHFVSNSPWKHQPVLDHIQRDVIDAIGDKNNGSIHIDECCFPKQGKDSVGAAPQYCGRLGKTANCQAGVFLGYAKDSYRTLIDERIYLPESWIKDKKRRKKCGVPWYVRFKKKSELAWDMIYHAQKKNKVPFGWIGMDGLYGRDSVLRNKIDAQGSIYIADIPNNLGVWLEHPKTGVPPRKKGVRGRNPTREKVIDGKKSTKVRDIKDQLNGEKWHHVFIRDTERRELWKGIAGLADYQVRSWTGWHHHMTITLMAMLYLMVLSIDLGKKADFLTVQDVKEIFEVIMPKRKVTSDELVQLILEKHKRRLSARLSHHRRNK